MTLQQKILAALAGSTSRTPMSTAQVVEVVRRWPATEKELGFLRDEHKVGHCRSIKGVETIDYWWLAGNVESKMLPQTAAVNRKTKVARAAEVRKWIRNFQY